MPQPKDVFAKYFTAFHRTVYRVSGGKVGGKGYGMPVVILTTTGRKTGKKRETVLTSPVQRDGMVVVVASWGGDDRHPTWFLNLRDDPAVELEIHGEKSAKTARVATAEEKEELWPSVVKANPGYAKYQTKTDRDIPLVILEDPAPGT